MKSQRFSGAILVASILIVAQHWVILIMGIAAIALIYLDILGVDQEELDKFGDDYRSYMQRVPRMNLLLGLIRWIRQRGH